MSFMLQETLIRDRPSKSFVTIDDVGASNWKVIGTRNTDKQGAIAIVLTLSAL